MEDYFEIGAKRILEELKYNKEQMEFVGKIYSLEKNSKLVKSVETKLTPVLLHGGPVLELKSPRYISMWVKLNEDLKKEKNPREVETILGHHLEEVGIPSKDLFCWTGNYSYGIEKQYFSADFQF